MTQELLDDRLQGAPRKYDNQKRCKNLNTEFETWASGGQFYQLFMQCLGVAETFLDINWRHRSSGRQWQLWNLLSPTCCFPHEISVAAGWSSCHKEVGHREMELRLCPSMMVCMDSNTWAWCMCHRGILATTVVLGSLEIMNPPNTHASWICISRSCCQETKFPEDSLIKFFKNPAFVSELLEGSVWNMRGGMDNILIFVRWFLMKRLVCEELEA